MLRILKIICSWWRRSCLHNWRLISEPEYHRAENGDLIATAEVRCKKCGMRRQNQVRMLCFSTEQVERLRQIKRQVH